MEIHGAGLVLEGGAARGVFTSGVLDYLMEQELYLPYVVGASAGACNAVDYVSRQIGRTRDCMIHKDKKYRYISLRHTLKTRHLFDMDMVFDKNGFTVSQGEQSMEVPWDEVTKVVRIPGIYVLYMSSIRAYLISDQVLGGEKEAFGGFLREVLPGQRLKRV